MEDAEKKKLIKQVQRDEMINNAVMDLENIKQNGLKSCETNTNKIRKLEKDFNGLGSKMNILQISDAKQETLILEINKTLNRIVTFGVTISTLLLTSIIGGFVAVLVK